MSTSRRPSLGAVREVAYDPAEPTSCSVAGGGWIPWMLLGMAVLFLLAFGVPGVLVYRDRMPMRTGLSASRSSRYGGGGASTAGYDAEKEWLRNRVRELEARQGAGAGSQDPTPGPQDPTPGPQDPPPSGRPSWPTIPPERHDHPGR